MNKSWGKMSAIAAGAALLVSACSSSATSSSSSTSTASSTASSAAPNSVAPLTNLTVAYAATGAGYSDLYVGVTDGIFKKYGLNVTLVQITPANLVSALISGSAQIGGAVADGVAAAILKGEPLEYVALTEGTYNLQLWVNKNITSIKQLAGQTLALTTQGSETDFGLTDLLQQNGMSPTSVTRKYLVSAAQQISAVRSGAAAGGLFQPPTAQTLTQSGGHVLASLSNLPYAVGAYSATTSYVSSHPQAVKDFYDAEVANLAYIRSHPSQTEAAIEKYNPQTTAANAAIAYNFFLNVWKPSPVVTESLIQAAFQRAATKAKTSVPSNVAQYIYPAP